MRIIVDRRKCVGCRYCEMVCAWAREGALDPRVARIRVRKDELRGQEWPIVCDRCGRCVRACPTGAIAWTEGAAGGAAWLLVEREKCVGCGECEKACGAGAIRLSPSDGRALLCDGCLGKPVCVDYCPAKAIALGW